VVSLLLIRAIHAKEKAPRNVVLEPRLIFEKWGAYLRRAKIHLELPEGLTSPAQMLQIPSPDELQSTTKL
jgi:hypothetical protein